MEEELRKQAVAMIERGCSVADVSRRLKRSRQWIYKWLGRRMSDATNWSESRSTAPHSVANKTKREIEELVVQVRIALQANPHMESGAYPIMHAIAKQGIVPPSVATINRILKKHGLVNTKQKYQKSGIDYPKAPINMQLMDLIGPRHLRGAQRFYLLTIISNETRHAGVYPIQSKSAQDITNGVVSYWKDYTRPDFLQMDNELSFKGSNRHPRGLGLLLRTALAFNVTPRFIPVSEPWRNGVIERFNQKVEKTLLTQVHADFDELCVHAREFMETHNREHHYSTLGHKTPLQLDCDLDVPIYPLDKAYIVGDRPILDSRNRNEIYFIRLVRSDCLIDVLNTSVKVDRSLAHTYVEAVLCINDHLLAIYQDGALKQTVEFAMPVI